MKHYIQLKILVFTFTIISVFGETIFAFDQNRTQTLSQSIESLKTHDVSTLAPFFHAVIQTGSSAIPVLIKNIDDPDWMVRQASIDALRRADVPCVDLESKIISRLNDESWLVRVIAYRYLAAMQCKSSADAIVENISRETNPQVKNMAIIALGSQGNPKYIPRLMEIQNDSNLSKVLRLSAATALAQTKGPYNKKIIVESLTDEDIHLNISALNALSLISDQNVFKNIDDIAAAKPTLKSLATITEKSIELNQPNLALQTKEKTRFDLISDKDSTVSRWAINELLRFNREPATIEKLKHLALTSVNKTDKQQPDTARSDLILNVLLEKRLITPEERQKAYDDRKK